jgi:hypothetical protein
MTIVDVEEWLTAHEAVVDFRPGSKVGIDFRRSRDSLRVQVSDWGLERAVKAARELDEKGACST